ncbi:MAG: hydroxymethylglutaryl-CoA reductase, degradative, partial [Candidatus Altiarchaeota archaeon]|nr:hydroxymethylglutaryl-CoA reductase, degradative [Candidatus Altiarchaeota archaeon]
MSAENKTSRISGFYKLGVKKRMNKVKKFAELSDEEVGILQEKGISLKEAGRMIENVIGKIQIPLGIATNFLINDKDYLIPMATEEPSVVAAASNAARMIREGGGFKASSDEPIMIGQIQLIAKKPEEAKEKILANKEKILSLANEQDFVLVDLGGGAKDLEVRILNNGMLIIHLLVDVRDAMGANVVNTMCEHVSPPIEEVTRAKVYLRILSNLATKRMAWAEVSISADALGGSKTVDSIILAYEFADADPYRAVTHNKGVMNGISAVALATGNDTRAVEAGIHAYASLEGRYRPVSHWSKDDKGNLTGRIEIPLA